MGQQQLLLITLAIIIVGIAIMVSFSIYRQSSINANRDNITNEGLNLASLALSYHKKPKGSNGEKSFLGWEVPPDLANTASGTFTATAYKDSVIIIGTGNEIISGYDHVQVKTTVLANSYEVTVIM